MRVTIRDLDPALLVQVLVQSPVDVGFTLAHLSGAPMPPQNDTSRNFHVVFGLFASVECAINMSCPLQTVDHIVADDVLQHGMRSGQNFSFVER